MTVVLSHILSSASFDEGLTKGNGFSVRLTVFKSLEQPVTVFVATII